MSGIFNRAVRLAACRFCCLISLFASGVMADASVLGQIPLPPGTKSRIIALDIVQNGHVLSIASLEPGQSMDETLDFYRTTWHSNAEVPGYVEALAGDWRVVSHLTDRHNMVVQFREGGDGVEGVMSALSLQPVASNQMAEHDIPPGGAVLATTSSRDAAITATTTVVGSHWRTGEVAAFYRDRLIRSGWSLALESSVAGPTVLFFERRGRRLELIVGESMDGGSIAVLNEVTSDV